VIPAAGGNLDGVTLARWRLTRLAAALVRDGVPVHVVMADARQGCDLASGRLRPRAAGNRVPGQSDSGDE
jgi:hypothetical protein